MRAILFLLILASCGQNPRKEGWTDERYNRGKQLIALSCYERQEHSFCDKAATCSIDYIAGKYTYDFWDSNAVDIVTLDFANSDALTKCIESSK
jgi:hypothetical protein